MGQVTQLYGFAIGIEKRAIGGRFYNWQAVTARRGWIVIVVAVARKFGCRLRLQRDRTKKTRECDRLRSNWRDGSSVSVRAMPRTSTESSRPSQRQRHPRSHQLRRDSRPWCEFAPIFVEPKSM